MEEFDFIEALGVVFGVHNVHVINEETEMPKLPRFILGQCSATPGALEALEANGIAPIVYLKRHESGDWGDLSDNDRQANEDAIQPDPEECSRILSAYHLADRTKIWIITEWDRSRTTILLPDEY
jgi:hypothetical protein